MRDIHPHWEAEEDRPVEVHAKKSSTETEAEAEPKEVPQPIAPTTVSRRPAAIVGMLVVLTMGYTFFQGLDNLTGQVTPSGASVRITDDGMMPSILNVEHGQTITFVNDTADSHRIESGTLCSDTGFCLQTQVLTPGQTATFTITPDMRSGSYEYASATSAEIRGSIVIVTETVDDFTDLSSLLQDSFMDEIGRQPTTSPVGNSTFVANGTVPRNPYTVESDRLHPFDGQGEPIPEAFGDNEETLLPAANVSAAQTTFAQTRGPIRQPETGAGMWIVIVTSMVILWRVTKHHFAVRY